MLTRRELLAGAAVFSSTTAASFALTGLKAGARGLEQAPENAAPEVIAKPIATGIEKLKLDLAERPTALPCFDGKTLPLWTFEEGTLYPIVRLKLGQRLKTHYRNDLPRAHEYVSIHWHGLRIPNSQDGVPFLTQQPIEPGQEGDYDFTPPDTGSFFFHTHCNSAEHFGRGLLGAIIIEGDEIEPPDAEYVLMMKDWRVSPDGKFLPFYTDKGAAKAGTNGTIRSVNGVTRPVIKVPSSADVRIRFYNVDPTRISDIGVEGGESAMIAVDGNGLTPRPFLSWRMGPAMRIDILLRTPPEGGTARLMDYFSQTPVVLAEFKSEGRPRRRGKFVAKPLKVTPYEKVDLSVAQHIPFDFAATPTSEALAAAQKAGIEIGSLCLSRHVYWSINGQSWPGMSHSDLGPPLAVLKSGKSYVFELKNRTPHAHPIHIHGHTFQVLHSNLRKLPAFRADTVLLLPKERIHVGLVAGKPGKWMFHCHIIEHQESGMMGYITVI